ncbi:galanin receptor 2b-like [Asterias amurensis]|uniref:galanin receptor 2b-like n=1 Tax=Asterias amurensis TaxID=7602 RepID=UPI003AB4328F
MASRDGLATALNVAIACSAIFGNGLVIFVMTVRRKHFGSFSNRLIRHQSIIDFISGLVFLLVTGIKQSSLLEENIESSFRGEILCRFIFSNFFVWGLSVASTYNLVVISLERFLATCYPVKHRNYCSLFKIKVSMYAVWIIGFTQATTYVFIFTAKQSKCQFDSKFLIIAKVPLFLSTVLVEYTIPVVLISFSYIRILLLLRHKLINGTVNQQGDGVFSKAKRNVILTALLAGIMFFLCWTPLEMMRFLNSVGITREPTNLVRATLTGLVMCNMSVNPVVYCFKYEHFRTQLKQLVRSRFGQNRVRPGVESIDGPTLSVPDTRGTAAVN